MKEQRISFETAKLVKEKGFGGKGFTTDWSYQWHTENKEYFLCSMPENNKSFFNGTTRIMEGGKEGFSATTQSFLQKWLREKHNIFVTVDLYHAHGEFIGPTYQYQIYKIFYNELEWKNNLDICGMDECYHPANSSKIYEEALEVGLFEALKLIK
jgi:hypothetical protein